MADALEPSRAPSVWDDAQPTTVGYLYAAAEPAARTPLNTVRQGKFVAPWSEPWRPIGPGALIVAVMANVGIPLVSPYHPDDAPMDLVISRIAGMTPFHGRYHLSGLGWESFDNDARVVVTGLGFPEFVKREAPSSWPGLVYASHTKPGLQLFVTGTGPDPLQRKEALSWGNPPEQIQP